MISIIIPTYRSPKYLDICLKSCIEQQYQKNQIIVSVDGYVEESEKILKKYEDDIETIKLEENYGLQTALNMGVINARNEIVLIINDDNVFCKDFDLIIEDIYKNKLDEKSLLTINQIEPIGPSIYNFEIKDFGLNPNSFKYEEYLNYEYSIRKDKLTNDGNIFPFAMYKKYYMAAGGFDTLYQSPFICDWDFFLKLELIDIKAYRTRAINLYHFGGRATKQGKEHQRFIKSELQAKDTFRSKWGIEPELHEFNLHSPKNKRIVRGIKFG